MSRIGKKPIAIPDGVTVSFENDQVIVSGPKGNLKQAVLGSVSVEIKDGKALVSPINNKSQNASAFWGLYRALVSNMIEGVHKGFEKKLEIEGVGYRAALQGDSLILNLGFVNPITVQKPEGISFTVEKNLITVSGIDKTAVGQIAAQIRAKKPAEPYKGKGIKYQGEVIRRKEGKKVVASKK